MFSTIKTLLGRLDWSPPSGATHVLQWMPGALLEAPPGQSDWWEVQPVDAWLAGQPLDAQPYVDAGTVWGERALRWALINGPFGQDAVMTRFEVEIVLPDGSRVMSPAYWIIPGAGRS